MELIDRRDAIRIVDSIDTWQAGWRGNAIESLKALPSAQTEPCKDALDDAYAHGYTAAEAKFYQWREEHECEDVVSREAMRDEIDKLIKIHFDRSIVLTKAKQALFNLPSVMPVRDCKGCRFKFLPERTEEAEIAH